jgi:hypothetical protein
MRCRSGAAANSRRTPRWGERRRRRSQVRSCCMLPMCTVRVHLLGVTNAGQLSSTQRPEACRAQHHRRRLHSAAQTSARQVFAIVSPMADGESRSRTWAGRRGPGNTRRSLPRAPGASASTRAGHRAATATLYDNELILLVIRPWSTSVDVAAAPSTRCRARARRRALVRQGLGRR